MMMKTFAAALALAAGLMLADGSAVAAEQTLQQFHGKNWRVAKDGFVQKNQCLKCHVSYEALAEQTKNVTPNPHVSHQGAVDCQECHQANKPFKDVKLMCNDCHNFTLKKK